MVPASIQENCAMLPTQFSCCMTGDGGIWRNLVRSRSWERERRRQTASHEELVTKLVRDDLTVVSGLAAGVDTVADETAIAEGGGTIVGASAALRKTGPPQEPPLLSGAHHHDVGLTKATIIVEARETAGTRTQARAALHQGRALFILDNCFRNGLTWPEGGLR
jgi:DNA processing protein